MIIGAVGLGVLIGLTLGALGGGGSILTVPALVFVLGLTAQQATSGSLVIVGVTSAIASVGYARSGHTRWGRGTALALVGVPASLLGSALNRHVDPDLLLLAFAALMLVAATGMLLRARPDPSHSDPGVEIEGEGFSSARRGAAGDTMTHLSTTTAAPSLSAVVGIVAAGLGIGFLTGFLGVGGGFIIVPVLVVLLRYDMPVAVGTSLLVISLNSAVALAARVGQGGLVWHLVLPFTVAAIAGSVVGQRAAERVDAASLTRAFAVLLLVVAFYVALRAALGIG